MKPTPENGMTTLDLARKMVRPGDDHSESYYARQIRGWVQVGVLHPTGFHGRGATAAAVFTESDILPCRILSNLTRYLGVDTRTLKHVVALFRNVSAPTGDGAKSWSQHPSWVVQQLKSGDRWHFVVRVKNPLYSDSEGEERFWGGFTDNPEFTNPIIQSGTTVSLVFDCYEIMRDLLDGETEE